jgi:very-short-patch-repair endonuclease
LARQLRKDLTEAEKYLWYVLRSKNLGIKFRRQAVIGRYIVDFVCFEKRLIIEVDGEQHAENSVDTTRDQRLRQEGFKVLRFWNHEVLGNREGVVGEIMKHK